MTRRKNPLICDCGKPLIHAPGQDHRIKCPGCVKNTKSKDVKKKAVEYLGGKCVDCGEDHIATLDFDHVRPQEKSFKISGSYMFLWRYLKKELDKCSIRCSNCHRKKHYEENK
jgi:hypothetical protein